MQKHLLALLCLSLPALAEMPKYDTSRQRDLEAWKPGITEYSRRHYGEAEWKLTPKCVILHYTAGTTFPWNLVRSSEFAGEAPGLASHYVVEGPKVYQILPPTVRSRAAFGINHRAVNIEMVGADAADMMNNRRQTMDASAQLVLALLREFQLKPSDVYSHQQVALMDKNVVPWVLDLVNPAPYHKIDPGVEPMAYILKQVRAGWQAPR
jgi:hypothetical protein